MPPIRCAALMLPSPTPRRPVDPAHDQCSSARGDHRSVGHLALGSPTPRTVALSGVYNGPHCAKKAAVLSLSESLVGTAGLCVPLGIRPRPITCGPSGGSR